MAPGPILLIFLVACPAEPGDSGGPEDPDPSQKPTWADQNRGLPGVESLCDRVSEVQAITAIDIDGPGEVLGRQSVSITL